MKRWASLLVLQAFCVLPFFGKAQCETELRIVTYDSIFYGTGNSFYNFNFPKFDPLLGTLVGVEFQTVVTVKYGFTIENFEAGPTNYRVRLYRDDEFSSPSLQTPLLTTTLKNFGPFLLGGNDRIPSSGPDYREFGPLIIMDKDTIVKTAFNTADYLGEGRVDIEYSTFTYSTTMGSVNNHKIESAFDTMQVSISYIYCSTSLLPADFRSFTAVKKQGLIALNWQVENDETGRRYEIEVSRDGKNFATYRNLPSRPGNNEVGNYLSDYELQSGESGKLLFRIKQTDVDGSVKYSALRIVDIGDSVIPRLKVFPNPAAETVNILFSNHVRGEWDVEIFAMDGKLIDRFRFNQKLSATIQLGQKYRKGIYIIRARNKAGGESFSERLVVR